MAFELHPILGPGQHPATGIWYAVSPEDCKDDSPPAKVGACAVGGAEKGSVLLSAGATPDGPYSDLYQLTISEGR